MNDAELDEVLNSYRWIRVNHYHMKGGEWEQRYRSLEAHHIEETEFLIQKVRDLARRVFALEHYGVGELKDNPEDYVGPRFCEWCGMKATVTRIGNNIDGERTSFHLCNVHDNQYGLLLMSGETPRFRILEGGNGQ
jgi:hypothetical protein